MDVAASKSLALLLSQEFVTDVAVDKFRRVKEEGLNGTEEVKKVLNKHFSS